MLELFGKEYYIDVDEVIKKCRPDYKEESEGYNESSDIKASVGENGQTILELNVFKFEVLKACIERVLNELSDTDPDAGMFGENDTSVSFKLAYNTLLKYNILIENEHGE